MQEATAEASRCLQCHDAPCQSNCPAGVDIPTFVGRIRTRDLKGALNTIHNSNLFAGTCGRVCPVEELCEKSCVLSSYADAIAIGNLQRFAADCMAGKIRPRTHRPSQNRKVAVIGSGPAGLAAAAELLRMGYDVEVFEERSQTGGLLKNGIPIYRLPKRASDTEIRHIERMGAKIHTKRKIMRAVKLLEEFAAVLVATGVCKCAPLQILGTNLKGVYSGTDLLELVAKGRLSSFKGKDVCVIGGGDVAVDAARSTKRLGAKTVYIAYRRSLSEMPASKTQVREAKEEGIETVFLAAPTRIIGKKGKVTACEFVRMRLGKPDKTGRRKPVQIRDSKFRLKADALISAIGQVTDQKFIESNPEIRFSEGLIVVNENSGMTTQAGVFAGGDAVSGGATVVQAVAQGKRAASGIHHYLSELK